MNMYTRKSMKIYEQWTRTTKFTNLKSWTPIFGVFPAMYMTKNNFSGDFQWPREFLSSVIWALMNLTCHVWNFSTFRIFFTEILTNFKVFSQNTNRFVHESVFIIFHEQMNIHEQMNMNNEQYIHANRMISWIAIADPRGFT